MDPLSLTMSVIGLVQMGVQLAKMIKDIMENDSNANRELRELAHRVDLCITLVGILGQRLDKHEFGHLDRVEEQTRNLIQDTENLFDKIRIQVGRFDYSVYEKAVYVAHAKELDAHYKKINELQVSFLFMLTVCGPVTSAAPQLGSFEGTIQQFPINVETSSRDPNTAPVTYQATLTLRPSGAGLNGDVPGSKSEDSKSKPKPTPTEGLNKVQEEQLVNLRRTSFWSGGFLKSGGHKLRKPKPTTYTYNETMSFDPDEEDKPKRRIFAAEARMRTAEVRSHSTGMPSSAEAKRNVDNVLSYLFDDSQSTTSEVEEEEEEDSDDEPSIRGYEVYDEKTGEVLAQYAVPIESTPNETRDPPKETAYTLPKYDQADFEDASANSSKQRRPKDRSPSTSHRNPDRQGYVSESSTPVCDGCHKNIRNMLRYRCSVCPDFDFCEDCFHDPKKTLRHEHPKTHFKTKFDCFI